ncbi:MAG: hypothetical protein QXT19_01120 [Candidatus Woesearchaeota archaeon]
MGVSIIVRGPEWFFGIDSLFEGFAAIALLLVILFSYKAYKLTKDKRYRTFGIAFGLMLTGIVARALADLCVYAKLSVHPLALMMLYAGYMGLTLVSIIVLFALTLKIKQRAPIVALLLVSLVLVLLSSSYRLSFHSISVILLAFIAYHFIRNYLEKKSLSALLVCISFVLLTLTHAAFIVDIVKQRFYIIGHLLHLVAFGLLFVALIKVLKKR